jgi:hypothetical protein
MVSDVTDLVEAVQSGRPILTDGGIETRIMFETDSEMDPDVQVAPLSSRTRPGQGRSVRATVRRA